MSSGVLIRTDDGAVRYVRQKADATSQPPRVGDRADEAGGRTIEDVVDLSAGLRRAEALRAGTETTDLAETLATAQQEIRDTADRFGALLSGGRADKGATAAEAVRGAVTEILSGPHPATTEGGSESLFARVARRLGLRGSG